MQMRREGHYKEASEYADFGLLLLERIPHKLGSNHGYVRLVASVGVYSAVSTRFFCKHADENTILTWSFFRFVLSISALMSWWKVVQNY